MDNLPHIIRDHARFVENRCEDGEVVAADMRLAAEEVERLRADRQAMMDATGQTAEIVLGMGKRVADLEAEVGRLDNACVAAMHALRNVHQSGTWRIGKALEILEAAEAARKG